MTCYIYYNNVSHELECCNEHSASVGDRFIVPVSLHYQIRIFTSSNTCFRFTAHAYPHYQLRVFTSLNTHIRLPLRGCFRICGRDKSAPTAANRLPITWRTIHETPTNIPPGVGADSSCPYPDITKNAYSFHRIRVSISPYTHFHIIKYVYPHHRTHTSVRHFVGVYVYAGTINRTPTAANGLR